MSTPLPRTARTRAPLRTFGRWALILAVAALRLYVAFLLVTNALLLTDVIPKMALGSGKDMSVRYGYVYTFWPGHFHVRDGNFRFQDSNIQFGLRVERGYAEVRLRDLFRREIHATKVRASGVTVLFRHKMEKVEGNELRVAAYPHIPGFEDPPLFEVGPKPPPLSDEDYNLWTVHLEDVDAEAREAWMMEYRYVGSARARGAFRLKPIRDLWVGPATLDVAPGTLGFGVQQIAENVRGTVTCTVHRFDPRGPDGMEVFRQISTSVRFEGDFTTLAFAGAYMGSKPPLTVAGGRGPFAVDVTMDRGALQPGGSVRFDTPRVELTAGATQLALDAHLLAGVASTRDQPRGEARVTSTTFNVTTLDERPPAVQLAKARGVELAATSTHTDVSKPWALNDASTRVASFGVDNLRLLDEALRGRGGSDVKVTGGAADGSFDAQLSGGGALRAKADVSLRKVSAAAGDVSVSASGTVSAKVDSANIGAAAWVRNGSIALEDVTVTTGSRKTTNYWVRVDAGDIALGGMPPSSASGSLHLRAKNAEPLLGAIVASGSVPAAVVAAIPPSALDAVADVRHGGGSTEVRLRDASSGVFQARGRMSAGPKGVVGAFLVRVGPVPLGIELRGGSTTVTPFASESWLRDAEKVKPT